MVTVGSVTEAPRASDVPRTWVVVAPSRLIGQREADRDVRLIGRTLVGQDHGHPDLGGGAEHGHGRRHALRRRQGGRAQAHGAEHDVVRRRPAWTTWPGDRPAPPRCPACQTCGWVTQTDGRKPPVAGIDGQGVPHRAVERIGPGEQRAGRRDAVRRLRRREERGPSGGWSPWHPTACRQAEMGCMPRNPSTAARSCLMDWARSAKTAVNWVATGPRRGRPGGEVRP